MEQQYRCVHFEHKVLLFLRWSCQSDSVEKNYSGPGAFYSQLKQKPDLFCIFLNLKNKLFLLSYVDFIASVNIRVYILTSAVATKLSNGSLG